MTRQIDRAKDCPHWDDIVKHYEWGFGVIRDFCPVSHTALDVAKQYMFADENKWIAKNDEVNYNNRWMQFAGKFEGKTAEIDQRMRRHYGIKNSHIYANWIQDGHNYGRHTDEMDVIILQVWGRTAYCCESVYGEKAHSSVTLNPGDAIFIRNGVFHTPIILEERMSMSFSWV